MKTLSHRPTSKLFLGIFIPIILLLSQTQVLAGQTSEKGLDTAHQALGQDIQSLSDTERQDPTELLNEIDNPFPGLSTETQPADINKTLVVTKTIPASDDPDCIANVLDPQTKCFNQIQDALSEAEIGYTILVDKGTYGKEVLKISTGHLTIRSIYGSDRTVITPTAFFDPELTYMSGISIKASGVEIDGFTITAYSPYGDYTGGFAIDVGVEEEQISIDHTTIKNNVILGDIGNEFPGINTHGIYVHDGSRYTNIENNEINHVDSNPILIENSLGTWIYQNSIHDINSYGIYLADALGAFISENSIQNTSLGILIIGSEEITIERQNISNLEGPAVWGIHSEDIRITDSIITNNEVGLEFYQTEQIYISRNEISNSTGEYNIALEGYAVSQIDIVDNLIRSNYTTPKGIVIRGNISDVTISNNKIEDHIEMGISIEPLISENDTVSDINIHNNSITFSYPHPEGSLYYGIHNSLPGIIDARYNWWGDNSGPYDRWVDQSIPVTNYNGKGSAVRGNVIYSNWEQIVVVEIAATPGAQVKEGTDITLTANVLSGNEPFTYSWAGDCSGDKESTVVPGNEGSYYCSVEITDADGDKDDADITVVILNNPPMASIAADPGTVVTEGTTVTLTALVTEGNAPFNYNWGGDCSGNEDTTQVPTSSGVYECNVTVTDNDGDKASASIEVIIFPRNMREKYRLEALIYGRDPSNEKSWTTGNVCQGQKNCYKNGDNIPTRIIIDGLMPKAPYSFDIEHDYISRKGNIGFTSFHNNQPLPQNVNAEGTTITLLSDTIPCAKGTCADYKVTFKATSDTVTIYWNSQLSDEASEWKGSSLQLRLKQGVNGKKTGNRTISINPKDLG